ncbi:uncharacterized protein LDX57_004421 [Aspergillus melleus]|uniref:uncharacterized protein n=1 Tax=Aspergillus melleus TaxID=138277 RepID=UPI001E8E7A63|nr:uncharacterized protein LDX57_004421 [Aspergillus melleus]KAH8426687.1 hypothetical protein LDX57_004421 [Aspergillus melleus]
MPAISPVLGLSPLLLVWLLVGKTVDSPVLVWVVDGESSADTLFGDNGDEVEIEVEVEVEIEIDSVTPVEFSVGVEAERKVVVVEAPVAFVDSVDVLAVIEVVTVVDTPEGAAGTAGVGLDLSVLSVPLLSSSGQMPELHGSIEQHPWNGPLEQTYQALPPEQDIIGLVSWSK